MEDNREVAVMEEPWEEDRPMEVLPLPEALVMEELLLVDQDTEDQLGEQLNPMEGVKEDLPTVDNREEVKEDTEDLPEVLLSLMEDLKVDLLEDTEQHREDKCLMEVHREDRCPTEEVKEDPLMEVHKEDKCPTEEVKEDRPTEVHKEDQDTLLPHVEELKEEREEDLPGGVPWPTLAVDTRLY